MNIEINEKTGAEICFRCPHCQKLYKTSTDVFEGNIDVRRDAGRDFSAETKQAEFDCSSCKKSFILKNRQDSFGLFTTSEIGAKSFATCPKCFDLKPHKSDECPNCGVLASKYIELQKVESPALFELNQQWQKVVLNFDQDQYHQDFINKCHLRLALNFAFQRYSDLQKSLGFDSLCEKYIRQIELRIEQQFKAIEATRPEAELLPKSHLSFRQYFFIGLGSVGMLVLIYNRFVPTFSNFSSGVMALTILAFGAGLFLS